MASGSVTYTPSPLVKWLGLALLLVGAVVLTYFQHVFPNWIGLTGIAAWIPTAFYFAAHEFQGTKPPNGLPDWTTFIVVTIASAVEGAVGYFVLSSGTIAETAVFAWLLVVIGSVFHAIYEDQGANAPANIETWATAGLGIAGGIFGFLLNNHTFTVTALVSTLILVVPQYIHINTDGSSVTVTPVPNPPPPPAPPSATTTATP